MNKYLPIYLHSYASNKWEFNTLITSFSHVFVKPMEKMRNYHDLIENNSKNQPLFAKEQFV